MPVSVQWCNDCDSYYYGYTFWRKREVIARCDEDNYHETKAKLEEQGYKIRE